MHALDWLVVVAYLVWIVYDGLRRSKGTDKVDGYFLANRSLPWWAVGLSVMATQMSAVTIVGTTGQAYATGLRFIQFYFGLPLVYVFVAVDFVGDSGDGTVDRYMQVWGTKIFLECFS